jgi:hypothetical protein
MNIKKRSLFIILLIQLFCSFTVEAMALTQSNNTQPESRNFFGSLYAWYLKNILSKNPWISTAPSSATSASTTPSIQLFAIPKWRTGDAAQPAIAPQLKNDIPDSIIPLTNDSIVESLDLSAIACVMKKCTGSFSQSLQAIAKGNQAFFRRLCAQQNNFLQKLFSTPRTHFTVPVATTGVAPKAPLLCLTNQAAVKPAALPKPHIFSSPNQQLKNNGVLPKEIPVNLAIIKGKQPQISNVAAQKSLSLTRRPQGRTVGGTVAELTHQAFANTNNQVANVVSKVTAATAQIQAAASEFVAQVVKSAQATTTRAGAQLVIHPLLTGRMSGSSSSIVQALGLHTSSGALVQNTKSVIPRSVTTLFTKEMLNAFRLRGQIMMLHFAQVALPITLETGFNLATNFAQRILWGNASMPSTALSLRPAAGLTGYSKTTSSALKNVSNSKKGMPGFSSYPRMIIQSSRALSTKGNLGARLMGVSGVMIGGALYGLDAWLNQ